MKQESGLITRHVPAGHGVSQRAKVKLRCVVVSFGKLEAKPCVKDRRVGCSAELGLIVVYSVEGVEFAFPPRLVSLSEVGVKVTVNARTLILTTRAWAMTFSPSTTSFIIHGSLFEIRMSAME
jgi:hypothetical protein